MGFTIDIITNTYSYTKQNKQTKKKIQAPPGWMFLIPSIVLPSACVFWFIGKRTLLGYQFVCMTHSDTQASSVCVFKLSVLLSLWTKNPSFCKNICGAHTVPLKPQNVNIFFTFVAQAAKLHIRAAPACHQIQRPISAQRAGTHYL